MNDEDRAWLAFLRAEQFIRHAHTLHFEAGRIIALRFIAERPVRIAVETMRGSR